MAHSIVDALDPVTSETTFAFDADGNLTVEAVGPANVAMTRVTVPAGGDGGAGFDDAALDGDHESGHRLGVNLERWSSVLGLARKGRGKDRGDRVNISADDQFLSTKVVREDENVSRTTDLMQIDPDSIRSVDIPDFSMPEAKAKVDTQAFHDSVTTFADEHDTGHFRIARSDLEVVSPGAREGADQSDDDDPGGIDADKIAFSEAVFTGELSDSDRADANAGTTLSTQYVTDIAKAIKATKADHVLIQLGEEYPVRFSAPNTALGIEVEYLVAPRIEGDDD